MRVEGRGATPERKSVEQSGSTQTVDAKCNRKARAPCLTSEYSATLRSRDAKTLGITQTQRKLAKAGRAGGETRSRNVCFLFSGVPCTTCRVQLQLPEDKFQMHRLFFFFTPSASLRLSLQLVRFDSVMIA